VSKWSVMCSKCGIRSVTVEVEAKRVIRKSMFYSYGSKKVLDAMTPDEINARKPLEIIEPVWILPPLENVLCRECLGGKKRGLSV